jgi:RNA recognition motif-containing protein
VGNLSGDVGDDDLRTAFAECGEVVAVDLKKTGRPPQ